MQSEKQNVLLPKTMHGQDSSPNKGFEVTTKTLGKQQQKQQIKNHQQKVQTKNSDKVLEKLTTLEVSKGYHEAKDWRSLRDGTRCC